MTTRLPSIDGVSSAIAGTERPNTITAAVRTEINFLFILIFLF